MTDDGVDSLVEVFRELSEHYEFGIHQSYGTAGVQALVQLIDCVKELFRVVPYEMLTDGLEAIVPVGLDDTRIELDDGIELRRFDELSVGAVSGLTVVIQGNASFRVFDGFGLQVDLAAPTLRYRFIHGRVEEISAGDESWPVNDTPWECGMAVPTFSSLEDALSRYVKQNRVPVQCAHLDSSWRDPARLAFDEKPEHRMRDSLLLALNYALQGVTVRPELNQSSTRPVDIEVSWWEEIRSAIIEIKWLGASGAPGADSFPTTYTNSRAVAGLRQLAEYLDLRDATTSDVQVMGYLFVFDGRRKGLTATQSSIDRESGLHYALKDPDYPAELLSRPDIGRPFRCFMEPVTS